MRGKKTYRLLALLLCLFLMGPAVFAQNKPPLEYQVKAAFLFNFTRFVHWPASAYESADAPFIIGIAGPDPFGAYLDDLVSGEQKDGHPIVVRRYADGQEVGNCQLLFINTADPVRLKATVALTARQSILTVSDIDSFIPAGGMVRFYKDDNKIKMEIKLTVAKAAQLEISAKLLQVAKIK